MMQKRTVAEQDPQNNSRDFAAFKRAIKDRK
jgi:hypothetical protein